MSADKRIPAAPPYGRTVPKGLPPTRHQRYYETSGLERSLATTIMDHPTAINVNSLRMERAENVFSAGYVDGIGSYDARVLTGNWGEERSDKSYTPSAGKMAKMGVPSMWQTEYMRLSEHVAGNVLPESGSNALNMYTHPDSAMYTGVRTLLPPTPSTSPSLVYTLQPPLRYPQVIHASASSNAESCKVGFAPGTGYEYGDARSASRPPGNHINYQVGMSRP